MASAVNVPGGGAHSILPSLDSALAWLPLSPQGVAGCAVCSQHRMLHRYPPAKRTSTYSVKSVGNTRCLQREFNVTPGLAISFHQHCVSWELVSTVHTQSSGAS